MVQHLTYRKWHSYTTKSNQTSIFKTSNVKVHNVTIKAVLDAPFTDGIVLAIVASRGGRIACEAIGGISRSGIAGKEEVGDKMRREFFVVLYEAVLLQDHREDGNLFVALLFSIMSQWFRFRVNSLCKFWLSSASTRFHISFRAVLLCIHVISICPSTNHGVP